MLDPLLRPLKDRLLAPLAALPLPPLALTLLGMALGLAASLAAWRAAYGWALGLFWAGRLCDGLDGMIARRRGLQSDLGGYLDLMADFVVYAALVLGLALAQPTRPVLVALAFLLSSYYVNAASWMLLSALLPRGRTTSLAMPVGLVGGAETMALYTLFLVFPGGLTVWFWLATALVTVGAGQRVAWAVRHLR